MRCLVVEDNLINRLYISEMLKSSGFSVEEACDGWESLEKLQQAEFDLVLMDIMMPGLDGIEATRMIRASPENYSEVPIVVVSACLTDEVRRQVMEAGANDALHKPLEEHELAAAIRRLVPHP